MPDSKSVMRMIGIMTSQKRLPWRRSQTPGIRTQQCLLRFVCELWGANHLWWRKKRAIVSSRIAVTLTWWFCSFEHKGWKRCFTRKCFMPRSTFAHRLNSQLHNIAIDLNTLCNPIITWHTNTSLFKSIQILLIQKSNFDEAASFSCSLMQWPVSVSLWCATSSFAESSGNTWPN